MLNQKVEKNNSFKKTDLLLVQLTALNNFSKVFYCVPNILACYGFRVLSVDVSDTVAQPSTFQSNWLVISRKLGNSSSFQYRINGGTASNVICCFSRNVTLSGNTFTYYPYHYIKESNFTDLDFSVVAADGSPIVTNNSTIIEITIEFLLNEFT